MDNITGQRSSEANRVEDAIFAALRHSELLLIELLEKLKQKGVSDEGIAKAAITRLLAESKLEMTPRRHIQLSSGCNQQR
jgi:hypothetical protein